MTTKAATLAILAATLEELSQPKKPIKRARPLNLAVLKPRNGEAKSLTHGQVQRRRKQLKKKNFKANVRYREAVA